MSEPVVVVVVGRERDGQGCLIDHSRYARENFGFSVFCTCQLSSPNYTYDYKYN